MRTRNYYDFITSTKPTSIINHIDDQRLSKFDIVDNVEILMNTINPTTFNNNSYGDIANNDRDAVYKITDPFEYVKKKNNLEIAKQKHNNQPEHKKIVIKHEDALDNLKHLKLLCDQEDLRCENSKTRLKRRMKNFGHTSRNLINKKIHVIRGKCDNNLMGGGVGAGVDANDESKIRSTESNSDISSSYYSSTSVMGGGGGGLSNQNSINDLRTIFKRTSAISSVTKPKFQRSASDGVGMAAFLIRSLMVAAPSLDSIAEIGTITPRAIITSTNTSSTKISTQKKLSSGGITLATKPTPYKSESLMNLPFKGNTTIGDNNFKTSDGNISTNFSISSCRSVSSGDEICSEEEEEDDDDYDDDNDDECDSENTQNESIMGDADTVSMIVKSVLAKEEQNEVDWIQPVQDDICEFNGNNKLVKLMQTHKQKQIIIKWKCSMNCV